MSVRPLAALLLVASLACACSAGGPDETVLVSRVVTDSQLSCDDDVPRCRREVPSQAFRAADGRMATVAAMATDTLWELEKLSEPQAECGGVMIPRQTYIWRAQPASDETSRHTITFDDGSAVQLFVESFIEVDNRCSEMVGRWEGVEGTFEGRSGTYRWTDDWLQDELVLTES